MEVDAACAASGFTGDHLNDLIFVVFFIHVHVLVVDLVPALLVRVLPVALKTDAWGLGTLVKGFGGINPSKTTHFAFGEPIEITGNGKEQHNEVFAFIDRHLKEWTA